MYSPCKLFNGHRLWAASKKLGVPNKSKPSPPKHPQRAAKTKHVNDRKINGIETRMESRWQIALAS
jgi:hypothetical protein